MARKKRKTTGASAPHRGGRGVSLAPFPPPVCAEPVWRHFWTLLAAGFALRLAAGLGADWVYREDEIMQYLEPTHRLLFGSGFMTWEMRYGVRNLISAAPAAGWMLLCDAVQGGPDCYVPALAVFNCVLSLAIPASLYFIARRLWGETAGRVALTIGCFWYTFVVFAPRLMVEQTSAILILSGMALAPPLSKGWRLVPRKRDNNAETETTPNPSALRLWTVGFLIGLGGFIRLQYIPVAGPLGLLILFRLSPRLAPHLVGGAVAAFAITGATDWVVWGGFFSSALAYVESAQYFGEMFAATPWHGHIVRMSVCSLGFWPLVFLAASADWRRHWLPLGAVAVLLVFHALSISENYSHIFLALPMLALAAGAVVSRPPDVLRDVFRGGGRFAVAGAVALASLGGAAHALPGQGGQFWSAPPPIPEGERRRLFFQGNPMFAGARYVSRLPAEKVRAVMVTRYEPLWSGGYFYLHHNVPYWHGGLLSHHQLFLQGRPAEEIASHIIAPDEGGARWAAASGFREIAQVGGARVFENPTPEKIQLPEKFPLGIGRVDDVNLDREVIQAGGKVPEPVFLPPSRK